MVPGGVVKVLPVNEGEEVSTAVSARLHLLVQDSALHCVAHQHFHWFQLLEDGHRLGVRLVVAAAEGIVRAILSEPSTGPQSKPQNGPDLQ